MMTIYRLQLDKNYITAVQKATRTTDKFGIEPTHGMFGSPEWWQHIRRGTLPVHHLKGTISSVHMGSMNDWPEFTLCTEDGRQSTWSRYANDPDFDSLYTVGRPIEIDYVIQRLRAYIAGLKPQSEVVIAVRVGETSKKRQRE